jgi:hypothetical protein
MKILLLLVAFLSFSACLAQTVSPDLDLSRAKQSQIVKVAQTEAKEFYQGHKANPEELSDALEYASGRAIKHGLLEGISQIYYTNAFLEVLKQLEIDKE